MTERRLLRRICGGDGEALGEVIERYTPYVCAVARNIVDPPLQLEDVEEICADVFVQLWKNAGEVQDGKLKAWLAAVTRNRAKDRLRNLHLPAPLEEDALEISFAGPEERIVRQELRQLTRAAVDAMPEPDRSIF
ncbi:MAG: sigma-70 family RNA polymerase sigma factor, partial [Oscillospiraceae bacterium]|nr:sigma-70 family RNA polymerase sigma factor [Oscillospiraceae bacterium]